MKLILGELRPSVGRVDIQGRVSYSSQKPWLFSGSVRSNILFDQPYDEEKYSKVTRACCLVEDFQQLPYGDRTLVGEKGAALSGGQCVRVNLARQGHLHSNRIHNAFNIQRFNITIIELCTEMLISIF